MKNSLFQTVGAFGVAGLNFLLMFGYARILGPESFGSLVTSQAQVLVWALLVDLGLSNGLIGTLTLAERGKSELSRQGFRARDLIFRVLAVRLTGALVGTLAVLGFAWLRSTPADALFWQDVAFVPFLFALALQQTAQAYAMFRQVHGFAVLAQLFGILVTVVMALLLAWNGASIPWLLLAQSWGGILSGTIIFGYFSAQFFLRRRNRSTRRLERTPGGPWGGEVWRALARDAWPYAIAYAVFVLWSRLDQLAASHLLGVEQGGQYALAVRLVAIPILVASAVSGAIFPDVQRVGRDAPERLGPILGAVSKVIYRYGIVIAALMLLGLGLAMGPLFPKFRPALKLLPWFVPGVWAYWMQTFQVNSLFGLRLYRQVVLAHVWAILLYAPLLLLLTNLFGLHGVVWAFNIFCLSMFIFSYRAVRAAGLLPRTYRLYAVFTSEERALWAKTGLLQRFRRGRSARETS